jgi:hypothetical protein
MTSAQSISRVRLLLFLVLFLPLGCTFEDLRAMLMPRSSVETVPTVVPTVAPVEAVYLPFQGGFMVYNTRATCLYAYADAIILPRDVVAEYNNYQYCLPFDELPAAQAGAPPDPFGRVWSRYAEARDALGEPTGDPVRYVTRVPPAERVVMGGVFYAGMMTLPDGTQLYCGWRGATAGSCQLR